MTLFATLKHNSHRALHGNWGKAILGMLVLGGTGLLLALIQGLAIRFLVPPARLDPAFAARYGFEEFFFLHYAGVSWQECAVLGVCALLQMLVLAPLGLGLVRWYWALVRGQVLDLQELFHFFGGGRVYLRSVWLHVQLLVRSFLWALVLYAVPAAIWGSSAYFVNTAAETGHAGSVLLALGMVLGGVLFVLAAIFYIALLNRYLLAPYLLCEDDSLPVRRAIRQSCAYTRGYRFSLLWYQLSFIGWFLLCVFLFPALFVYPYFNAAVALYASYLVEKNRFTPPAPTMEYRVGHHAQPAEKEPGQAERQQPEADQPTDGVQLEGCSVPPSLPDARDE